MPSFIEVCPVELPGHGQRFAEAPLYQIEPLVRAAAQGLQPYLDRPFALFGHSLGALVSFELARYLRKAGAASPAALFVSGHSAPQLSHYNEPVHSLSDDDLIRRIRGMKGTDDYVLDHPELRALLIPVFRSDFSICETYTFKPDAPLDCPIFAFGGLEDDMVPENEIEAWRVHTSRTFSMQMLPGDHFFINTSRQALQQYIGRDLALVLRAAAARLIS